MAFAYVGTVNQSTAGVYGFSIASDGSATPVSGSPVAGPSSYVLVNSAFVFATDGTNIATYARASDGSLTQSSTIDGALNPGGPALIIQELSLDRTGQTLYAMVNEGSDDKYYAFFAIGADGKLTNIGKAPVNVDDGSALVFSTDNNFAYGFGCFFADWDVTQFARNSNGSLAALSSASSAGIPEYAGSGQRYCPTAEATSKTGYLAVADTTAANTQTSGLGAYKINSDGSLTFVQSSTIANLLPSVNAMNFDPNGQFLAVAGNGGIQVYQLSAGGAFTPVGGVQAAGANYLAVQWDNDNHLYAASASGFTVFTSTQGILTAAPGSPHSAGTSASLTVLPAQ